MMNMEIETWMEKKFASLFIAKSYHHHHAREILNSNGILVTRITESLSRQIAISPRMKITKNMSSAGIKAEDLNKEIRRLLREDESGSLKFEVFEERGVFYFNSESGSIGGFDFAYINHAKNLNTLRNICFGEVRYHDGMARWNGFLNKNRDLEHLANSINSNEMGKDTLYANKDSDPPLFVGEIQFGNWALAYRDFFKVLKANVQNSIDCLIYIVPTGNLESMLSDGIVTYDKTVRILNEFEKVISVPVWVVGMDIKV